jgi:hypothetical protein
MELLSPLILNLLSQEHMLSNQSVRARFFFLCKETAEVAHGECKGESHRAQGEREENIPSHNSRDKKKSTSSLILMKT